MMGPGNERRRLALQAVACVVFSASVGIAAGAGRSLPRAQRQGAVAPPAAAARPVAVRQEAARPVATSCGSAAGDDGMLLVPAGTYRSFFKRGGKALESPVAAFRLDRLPVSRAAFADFVRGNPAWRRSQVRRLFAEEAYLSDFASDVDAGPDGGAPVTFVSWFVARAYCECCGKRLVTLAEWERAVAPDPSDAGATAPPSKSERLAFAMGGRKGRCSATSLAVD